MKLRRYEEGFEIPDSKNLEIKLIYPFNSKSMICKRNNLFIYILDCKSNTFEFVDLKKEENREIFAIETKLKEKQRNLKFLFLRYSNTGFNGRAETFEKLESQAERITLQEINKMISENGISKLISLEEIAKLIRLTDKSNIVSKLILFCSKNINRVFKNLYFFLLWFFFFFFF